MSGTSVGAKKSAITNRRLYSYNGEDFFAAIAKLSRAKQKLNKSKETRGGYRERD